MHKHFLPVVGLVLLLQVVALLSPQWSKTMVDNQGLDVNPFGVTLNTEPKKKMNFPAESDLNFPMPALNAVKSLTVISVVALVIAVGLKLHCAMKEKRGELVDHSMSHHARNLVWLSLASTLVVLIVWPVSVQAYMNKGLPDGSKLKLGYAYWVLLSSLVVGVGFCGVCHYQHRGMEAVVQFY